MAGMADIYDYTLTQWDKIDPLNTLVTRMGNLHIQGNVQLNDDRLLSFGDDGSADAYIKFVSPNLTFFDVTVGTTKTLTQLAASSSQTLDQVFDNGKIIDGATSSGNAMQVGGTNDKILLYEEGSNDVRIATSSGAVLNIDANGGYVNILSDTTKLGFGAAGGSTDAYIYFNGTSMVLYDSQTGAEFTLQQISGTNLNSPTVTGDMTISDGKVVQTNTDDEVAYLLTSSSTTNDVFRAVGNVVTSGALVAAYATEATLSGGFYFRAYDNTGAANVFTVGEDGAVVIAGPGAGTDAVTLTTGDLTVSSGDVVVSVGTITVADTADSANKISRNNGTGTNPVLEVEQTHATGGVALLIDQNATADVNAVEITNAGTGFALTSTGGVAGAEGFEFIAAASATGNGLLLDGTTGSWIGAATTGFAEVTSDGTLAQTTTSLVRIAFSGTSASGGDGTCLNVVDTSTSGGGTEYAVHIASTNSEALHVDAGMSLFDERVTITLADNTGPALAITNPDTTGNTDAVTITPSGSGCGLLITPQETDTQGLKVVAGAANTTVSLVEIDGATADWIGGAATGMVYLNCDAAVVADGTLLRIASSGQPAAANDGVCLEIVESGAARATSYAVRIASTNNEALHVDTGKSVFDELVTCSGGVVTIASTDDVGAVPSQAEMVAAFGAASQGAGMLGFIDDAGGGANAWLCVSDGTNWFYAAKLTVGA